LDRLRLFRLLPCRLRRRLRHIVNTQNYKLAVLAHEPIEVLRLPGYYIAYLVAGHIHISGRQPYPYRIERAEAV
jgi:hypothetical protein